MERKGAFRKWVFIFFVVISFYSLGAGIVESFVNYPVWYIIGPSEQWKDYHIELGERIIIALAIPALLLQLLANILLLFFRPMSIPRSSAWVCLVLLLVSIVSSFAIQIPIQMQLDQGYSKVLVDKLIWTDLVLRIAVGILRCGVVVWIMERVVRNSLPVTG